MNKQLEKMLIRKGLECLLLEFKEPKVVRTRRGRATTKKGFKGKKWSPQQREKFQNTMKKVWDAKKIESKG